MHETCRCAVYDVSTPHIIYEFRLAFYTVRLEIYRYDSIFYVEIEPAVRWHCRSPPSEIFEAD